MQEDSTIKYLVEELELDHGGWVLLEKKYSENMYKSVLKSKIA